MTHDYIIPLQNQLEDTVIIPSFYCRRCDGFHINLHLKKLNRPIYFGIIVATHWAICVRTNEPILYNRIRGNNL